MDVPLPEGPRETLRDAYSEATPEATFISFSIIGLILGSLFWIFTSIISALIGGIPAAALSGLIVASLLEMVSRGRCISGIASCADLVMGGAPLSQAFTAMDDDVQSSKGTFGSIKLVSVFLLRVFCVGYLVYNGLAFWLLLAVVFNFTARAQLSVCDDLSGSGPFLEMESSLVRDSLWIGVGLLTIIVGFPRLTAALLVLALTIIAVSYMRKLSEERLGGMTGLMIDVTGYAVETWTLLIGVIACANVG